MVRGKKGVTGLEASLADVLEKLATLEGRVRKLDVYRQVAEGSVTRSEMKKHSTVGKFRLLETNSAGLCNKLQVALSLMLEQESQHEQPVVADYSAESETVAALKTLAAVLWSQLKTMKARIVHRALTVDKIARIGAWTSLVRGEVLAMLDCLKESSIGGRGKVCGSLKEATGYL